MTTLRSTTRAFLDTSGALTSAGAVAILATSGFDIDTTANATPTVDATNNGAAVANNLTLIIDEAFVDGTPTITTTTLSIRTGGGSTLSAVARSGAAGSATRSSTAPSSTTTHRVRSRE